MGKILKVVFGALVGIVVGLALLPSPSTIESVYRDTSNSVVKLTRGGGGGTGFALLTPSGRTVIVTNRHICQDNATLTLENINLPRAVQVRVIEVSIEHDLCVVEAPRGLTPLQIGSAPSIGDRVFVSGHPRLLPLTVTRGHFRAVQEIAVTQPKPACEAGDTEMGDFFGLKLCATPYMAFEITATIHPGNSGSPLLNADGEVIGVIFAGSPFQSAAVPIEYLERFISVL